jgi:hypothetical protein
MHRDQNQVKRKAPPGEQGMGLFSLLNRKPLTAELITTKRIFIVSLIYLSELLTNASRLLSGDQDGAFRVPCPPNK